MDSASEFFRTVAYSLFWLVALPLVALVALCVAISDNLTVVLKPWRLGLIVGSLI